MQADVVVAGGGISGLLLASELSRSLDVVLLEQRDELPTNKYWLTDEESAQQNPTLEDCIATRYDTLDFIAYDETSATLRGAYVLWDTERLVKTLADIAIRGGTRVLLGRCFKSYRQTAGYAVVTTGSESIRTRLIVDCMGYESPIVSAKRTVSILGFFAIQGRRFELTGELAPVGLHNALIQGRPTYFELFPDGLGMAYGAMIQPTLQLSDKTTLAADFRSVLEMPPYGACLRPAPDALDKRVFGIVPVGVPRVSALDRVAFFGEAAQANPPTSATGLTRMLYNYRSFSAHLEQCVRSNQLDKRSISSGAVSMMSSTHRRFQLALFRRLLNFTSDDFRRLVIEIERNPDSLINDLIFAKGSLSEHAKPLAQALLRPNGLLGGSLLRSLLGTPRPYSRPSR